MVPPREAATTSTLFGLDASVLFLLPAPRENHPPPPPPPLVDQLEFGREVVVVVVVVVGVGSGIDSGGGLLRRSFRGVFLGSPLRGVGWTRDGMVSSLAGVGGWGGGGLRF